jgi:hypothetical protein
MQSRSRSPSPSEFVGGRSVSVSPRRNMWAVRQIRDPEAIASARIQKFGTTVIPCALFLHKMDHFDGTRNFGLINHGDKGTWYTLVQMDKSGRHVDIDLMDIDVGRRFDMQTMQLLVVPRRDGRTRNSIDFQITCCDRVYKSRRRVQHICEENILLYVFDDQGLLKWRYENGTLYISQFSLKPRERLILQGIEDAISLYENDTESPDVQGTEHAALLFMRHQYTDERAGPREIILATIRVSDYFDDTPTKFILEKGAEKVIINSCGYMKEPLSEYLMNPDEAQFAGKYLPRPLSNVRELTALYEWIKGGPEPL